MTGLTSGTQSGESLYGGAGGQETMGDDGVVEEAYIINTVELANGNLAHYWSNGTVSWTYNYGENAPDEPEDTNTPLPTDDKFVYPPLTHSERKDWLTAAGKPYPMGRPFTILGVDGKKDKYICIRYNTLLKYLKVYRTKGRRKR
jgi:hypothetical protein